jgi:hypothetical protein
MNQGARSPEELETLLEDAFVTRDRRTLAGLFEDDAVLLDGRMEEARGKGEIRRCVAALWARDYSYLADPRLVVQARSTALVLADRGVNVAHRGADGAWRYAIALLKIDQPSERKGT